MQKLCVQHSLHFVAVTLFALLLPAECDGIRGIIIINISANCAIMPFSLFVYLFTNWALEERAVYYHFAIVYTL